MEGEVGTALGGLDEIMPVRLTAASCDLVTSPPAVRADVALMLKTLTTIDQQSPGAAGRVLAALDCRHVILSLPRRSLSGRRGYSADPAAIAQDAAAARPCLISAGGAFGGP